MSKEPKNYRRAKRMLDPKMGYMSYDLSVKRSELHSPAACYLVAAPQLITELSTMLFSKP